MTETNTVGLKMFRRPGANLVLVVEEIRGKEHKFVTFGLTDDMPVAQLERLVDDAKKSLHESFLLSKP